MEYNTQKTNWKVVITFYLLACLFSWPFFAWRDLFSESWRNWHFGLKNLLIMWGPGFSAIICFLIFKKSHKRTISFLGNNKIQSLLFYLVPFAIWILLSFLNPIKESIKWIGIIELMPLGLLMIFGEELGWRGFLQDELSNIKENRRWIIMGLFWEMWHFTRGMIQGTEIQIILRKSLMLFLCIVISTIIGKATEKTKSLIIAIALHSWTNIIFEFPNVNTYITFGISIILWTLILFYWKNQQEQLQLNN